MNIKNLIKINFISIFKGMFGYKKMRQGRRFALTAILLLALIYFAFGNLMDMMMQYFVALKSPSYVLFMGAIITFAFVLFFITYESQNYFFKTKDFDLLASLPLKNIEIVIAKYTSVLLSAYLYASFFMFPSIVVYFMYVPFNFVTLLLLIVSFVFMPLVPMALGTLLGLLVSFLSSKLKKQNIISIILFLVLFVAYFFLYFSCVSCAISFSLFLTDSLYLFIVSVRAMAVTMAIISHTKTTTSFALCFNIKESSV